MEPVSWGSPWAGRERLATTAGKEEADGRKKLSCGWADLLRDSLSPPSVVMPELQELLTPEGPSWSLRKGLCVSCPARCTHGEKVGKERRKVKGTISSFSCGLQKVVRKAGEYEIRVQESQRWWGSTKDGQKRSELSFQKPVPCTCRWGNVASRRAGSGFVGCQHWPEPPDKGKEMETPWRGKERVLFLWHCVLLECTNLEGQRIPKPLKLTFFQWTVFFFFFKVGICLQCCMPSWIGFCSSTDLFYSS